MGRNNLFYVYFIVEWYVAKKNILNGGCVNLLKNI